MKFAIAPQYTAHSALPPRANHKALATRHAPFHLPTTLKDAYFPTRNHTFFRETTLFSLSRTFLLFPLIPAKWCLLGGGGRNYYPLEDFARHTFQNSLPRIIYDAVFAAKRHTHAYTIQYAAFQNIYFVKSGVSLL